MYFQSNFLRFIFLSTWNFHQDNWMDKSDISLSVAVCYLKWVCKFQICEHQHQKSNKSKSLRNQNFEQIQMVTNSMEFWPKINRFEMYCLCVFEWILKFLVISITTVSLQSDCSSALISFSQPTNSLFSQSTSSIRVLFCVIYQRHRQL